MHRSGRILEPDVLVTKVTIPPLRPSLLPRAHLLEQLNQSRSVPLTLLAASAGFGKTTLLAAWAHQSTSSTRQVAWLTLDAADNDPTRFWTYVLAALRHSGARLATVGEPAEALRHAPHPHPQALSNFLTALINDLAAGGQDITLILDDFHLLNDPAIHDALQVVLDHCPACLHVLLASRADPPLALARMRARGHLAELREADLRVRAEEAASFLNDVMGLALSEDAVRLLEMRTEGWMAGLQLAALSLRGHRDRDASAFLRTFAGSQRVLLDYVDEEILKALPEAQRRFLLQTSVLERMNADLCQALTGQGEPASQQLLETLERAHLFLLPLDEERRWYRYHTLFREALLARVQVTEPEHVSQLHREAARWYAAHGLLHEAIPHALAAQDYGFAADLLERWTVPQHWRNEYHLLRRWVAQLPETVLQRHPELSLAYLSAVVLTSPRGPQTLEVVQEPLRWAEDGYRVAKNQAGVGAVMTARAMLTSHQGEFARAFAMARQALALLPEDELQWRGHALCLVGWEAAVGGQVTQAQSLLRQGLAIQERSETLPGTEFALAVLGDVYLEQGELHLAAHALRQVLASAEAQRALAQIQLTLQTGERETYYERMARFGLAALAYEWNDLAAAERLLRDALAGPAEWRHVLSGGVLLQMRLLLARGGVDEAREALADLAVQPRHPAVLREIRMCEAYVALAAGDLALAQRWAATLPLSPQPDPAPPLALTRREEEIVLLARLHLAEGHAQDALSILARWQPEARTEERQRGALQSLILQALAYQVSGAVDQARATLLQALALARPAGYQRVWLDAGPAIVPLLKTLVPNLQEAPLAAYVRTLLHASSRAQPVPMPPQRQREAFGERFASSFLPEPLTPQEHRVLQLVAEGASNQEIATRLVVSLSTAKKHVANILSKLGAENRTQAIARARALDLL